jgi:hypothetical protein
MSDFLKQKQQQQAQEIDRDTKDFFLYVIELFFIVFFRSR